MYVCKHTDIAVNFQVQNPIVLFESCPKKSSYFLCILLSFKKNILRSSRLLFVKLSGIFYLTIKYHIDCDIKRIQFLLVLAHLS